MKHLLKFRSIFLLLIALALHSCTSSEEMVESTTQLEELSYSQFVEKYMSCENSNVPLEYLTCGVGEKSIIIEDFISEKLGQKFKFPDILQLPTVEYFENQILTNNLTMPDVDRWDEKSVILVQSEFQSLNSKEFKPYRNYILEYFERKIEFITATEFILSHPNEGNIMEENRIQSPPCSAETDYLEDHWQKAIYINSATVLTSDYITEMFGDPAYDNTDAVRANAVKHAMWNYLIAQKINDAWDWTWGDGRRIAKEFTDIHEQCGGWGPVFDGMDYHNNQFGRDLTYIGNYNKTQLFDKFWEAWELAVPVPGSVEDLNHVPQNRLVFLEVYLGNEVHQSYHNHVEDQYLYGDWNGNGTGDIIVRREGNVIKVSGYSEFTVGLGFREDQYLTGNLDGIGTSDIIVRRNNQLLSDTDRNGSMEFSWYFGNGNSEDQYLIGNVGGDAKDDIVIRRGNQLIADTNRDGYVDFTFNFGFGNTEDQYLLLDVNGNGVDDVVVRRGNQLLSDTDRNGYVDFTIYFGNGNAEDEYMGEDVNGDGRDEIIIRRDNRFLADTNLDGSVDYDVSYGNGTLFDPSW